MLSTTERLLKESPRDRMMRKQQEEEIAKYIMDHGERLGLSWYKIDNEYYQVYNKQILRSKQKNLKINQNEGWFILDIEHTNAVLLYIDGVEKILHGVNIDDVTIYPDKYYLFRQPLENAVELWRLDSHILTANNIYRLNEKLWCVQSNGIYYLSNLDERSTIPIGKYPLEYDQDTGILKYYDAEIFQYVDISGIMNRYNR